MYDDELYKKSWDGALLSCVSQEDMPKIIAEVHQGWVGSVQHQPITSMTPILNPVPFAMWGVDLVGKLPKAKGITG
ncbi:hypothetical protein LIER_38640 [Lithospermum erythrorhizon]|uniref:Uncharacterized protein n=1 Tax=Lithospermum erythrorhizon TaxID=34254 RepID=A0AAV3Q4F9_LITER